METSPGDEEESKLGLGIEKHICRCCLTTEKLLKSAVDVQQYFMELAGINVSVSDGMPLWVCVECSALMQKAIAFKYKMLRAHSVLYDYIMKCPPSPIEPADPELAKYKAPNLTTTHTLLFDSTGEKIGFHEVLQQEKQILKSELNTVPLQPTFEKPQTAFESVEAAFSDFEDDPLNHRYEKTEDEEDLDEEEDPEEEEPEEEEDLEEEEEEEENTEDEDDDDIEDSSDEEENSEPEVKKTKRVKEDKRIKMENVRIVDDFDVTPDVPWTCENDTILIDFVRRNEALYNPKCDLYKIGVLKQKLWRDIGAILNKSDTDCYKRWCYVRDYYIRRRGKRISGEAASNRASLLTFLDTVPSAQRGWPPGTHSSAKMKEDQQRETEDKRQVKEERSNAEHDPWEGIRIGDQYCKMGSSTSWQGEHEDILINFVRRHEALFNPKCKDYRRPQVKQKLWREIATVLNKTDTDCYKKWCYVRDYYTRRRMNPGALSSGKAAKRRAELLTFLDEPPQRPETPPSTDSLQNDSLKSELHESQSSVMDSSNFADDNSTDFRFDISSKRSSYIAWSSENDEILINFVRQNEVIYNPKNRDYRKASLKRKLWADIGSIIDKTDVECFKRWCYVRDYYIRRRGKHGILSVGKEAKRRAELLSFLDNVPSPQRGGQASHQKKSQKSDRRDEPSGSPDKISESTKSTATRGHHDQLRNGDQHSATQRISWTSENDGILIDFVKKNQALYNPKCEMYKVGALKQKLWRDIGAILKKRDTECYKRWCYVRDYYIRRRDKQSGGEAAKRRAARLYFLDKITQRSSGAKHSEDL